MNELTTAIFIISLALNGLLAGGYIEEYRKNTYREEVHQHGQKLAKSICNREKQICSMTLAITESLRHSPGSEKKEFLPGLELLTLLVMEQHEAMKSALHIEGGGTNAKK